MQSIHVYPSSSVGVPIFSVLFWTDDESSISHDMKGIAGKIALVTGAAGGIGAEVVRSLHREGAHVVALDSDGAAVESFAATFSGQPLKVRGEAVDVRRLAEVEAAIERVEREWGPIDLGVNVAGVFRPILIADTSPELWREIFDVNALGVFNVSRALTQRMTARRRGSLVTVSSNAAGVPRHGMAAYASSKAAASMFTRCLGLEVAEFGVRCNIVAPGSTRTPMQESMWAAGVGPDAVINGSLENYRTGIPLRKLAEPGDVADATLFLLSDQASHITMAEIYVDGGATLRA